MSHADRRDARAAVLKTADRRSATAVHEAGFIAVNPSLTKPAHPDQAQPSHYLVRMRL